MDTFTIRYVIAVAIPIIVLIYLHFHVEGMIRQGKDEFEVREAKRYLTVAWVFASVWPFAYRWWFT